MKKRALCLVLSLLAGVVLFIVGFAAGTFYTLHCVYVIKVEEMNANAALGTKSHMSQLPEFPPNTNRIEKLHNKPTPPKS